MTEMPTLSPYWDECTWQDSTTVNYKNCIHLKADSDCALKRELECDTVCNFEEKE